MNTADRIRELELEVADINRRLIGVRGGRGGWLPVLGLGDLTDVTLGAPIADQVLKYDGAIWEEGDATATLAGLTDVNLTAPGRHHFLMYDPVAAEWINFELDLDFEDDVSYTVSNMWEALVALIRIEDSLDGEGLEIIDAL